MSPRLTIGSGSGTVVESVREGAAMVDRRRARRQELWRETLEQVRSIDEAVYEAVASTSTPALDESLARLSDTANHSKLWFAAAGVVAVAGGKRGRRAALEGVAAIGLASAAANLIGKNLTDRARPSRRPPGQGFAHARYVEMPTSTSFPSGHSASAFAFASAVGARIPALAIPLDALAFLVAYSRVHTGVHYPGDVVAGAFLGRACAKAVSVAGRRLPVREPAASTP